MPFIGWILGKQVEQLISNYDHWIAFGLLAILGFKMVYESFKKDKSKSNLNPFNLLDIHTLTGQVALWLMRIHALWATYVVRRGSEYSRK